MEIRKFTVPFSEILAEDATELSFGPGDYLVIRPLFSRPSSDIRSLGERLEALSETTTDAVADALLLDIMDQCVLEWHLDGPEGAIPIPKTPAALNALPAVLRGALFPFLSSYRGKGPNPTSAG